MTAEQEPRFTLVGNDAGLGALWPATTAVPAGWAPLGFAGTRAECLAEIGRRGEQPGVGYSTGTETLLSLVDRSVAGHPDRRAVSDDSTSLTYVQLHARAAAFGHLLAHHGVGPGDRVVVHLRRGTATVVALLGVLNAGAAYVAVDPRYPDERRDLMIRDSRPALVVTEPDRAERLAASPAPVLGWDGEATAPAAGPAHRPGAADVACVLFTSGSTGRPKAIQLEHGNLVYFAANAALPALRPTDRVGQVSSVSFDAFHFEVWRTLVCGAEVVVLPSMADLVANDLRRELRRRRVTALLAPTMAVNHLVYEDQDAFSPLRLLHTGGDVLQRGAGAQLLAGSFVGEFHNLYGPAEAATACTAYRVNDLPADADTVPIGTPLDGAAVYLLDPGLGEVPDGEVGEIHIGGAGVGRGYLGAPELTARAFLPDPFGKPGSRMYATGDLGRRTPSGSLEFVGRVDDQVKIRGYRVEPGEVERTLIGHRAVREAAVVAVGRAQDLRLVAMVALDEALTMRELRAFAAAALPDYLVPSSFVRVAGLPATEHGKRDLVRLRELADEQERRQRGRIPPRDEVERHLARAWEEMLGVEWVSRSDDFFALGGNSLLAFRLQRRITRDLGKVVDVRRLLATSRLADLADLVREAPDGTGSR